MGEVMIDWNLPPGVTEDMIPGNRPEDLFFDQVIECLSIDYSELSIEQEHAVDARILSCYDEGVSVEETVSAVHAYLGLEE
jgi:hypothetical protein